MSRSKFIYIYSPDPQPAEEVADEQTEPAVVEEVQLEQAISTQEVPPSPAAVQSGLS